MEANEARGKMVVGPRLTLTPRSSGDRKCRNPLPSSRGASQGIGQATALRLARDFSALVLVARNRASLEQTAEAVKAAGATALVIDADLRSPKRRRPWSTRPWPRSAASTRSSTSRARCSDRPVRDDRRAVGGGLALKLHGARRLTIAAWPALKAAKGAVVLMSGNSALFPKAPYAAVGTINAAIVALAKAFSDRGITDDVQVNSVLPGPVMTGRRRSYLQHWAPLHNMTVEEATAQLPEGGRHCPLRRAEEIAELMAFLVSPGCALDDRLDAAHGWRRGEIDLAVFDPDSPIRRRGGRFVTPVPRRHSRQPARRSIRLLASSGRKFLCRNQNSLMSSSLAAARVESCSPGISDDPGKRSPSSSGAGSAAHARPWPACRPKTNCGVPGRPYRAERSHFGTLVDAVKTDMHAVRRRKQDMIDREIAFHLKAYQDSGAELIMGTVISWARRRSRSPSMRGARVCSAATRSSSTSARTRLFQTFRACGRPVR